MTTNRLPLAAALVTVTLWASAFVGIRAAGRAFSPGALALGRLLIGTVLLGLMVLARPKVRPTAREAGLLVLAGLLWFGLYNVVLNAAEQQVDAGTAAMLVNVGPIFIIILAALFLKEKPTRWLLVGCGVAFAGIVLIGIATSSGQASLLGAVLCLVAAFAAATGHVAQKPVVRRMPALQVTWICCAIGAIACLPYAATLLRELQTAPLGASAWLVYLGAFPTSIAFTLWAYALAHGSAGRLGATAYLAAPIAIVLSAMLLRELPSALAIVGGAVSFAGVAIARRS